VGLGGCGVQFVWVGLVCCLVAMFDVFVLFWLLGLGWCGGFGGGFWLAGGCGVGVC